MANQSTFFPIIGIGASAGGLAAYENFFSYFPIDHPDCAFVLIQHLSPDHKSSLCEIIRHYTPMNVWEVEDGMEVNPNSIYVIPPGYNMFLSDGSLHLIHPEEPMVQRLPIDFFFKSLAKDQQNRAIGIILSGTGSDGTQGALAIKDADGMVIAQTLRSAEYDGMPSSAIAIGAVDYELSPNEMGIFLVDYLNNPINRSHHHSSASTKSHENNLKKIFALLRTQTGHDFSQYKPSTIYRRIERRMSVHQLHDLSSYVKYAQTSPEEIEELFRDLLIGVTNFFRDPEVFAALEERIIPLLFEGKSAGDTVRIWSCGCSSGEEAYSIAILIQEYLDKLKTPFHVQIFATDIDAQAIAFARQGLYPPTICADISPQRLKRFFTPEAAGHYRIQKNIRDMLIFSQQNLIKDPPFSKLDMISCRNLLIYLGSPLQKRVIPLFHYALNPKGILLLGTSEGIGEFDTLFLDLDRKLKLYQRQEYIHAAKSRFMSDFIPFTTQQNTLAAPSKNHSIIPSKLPLRELTEQGLLAHLSPTGILVNALGDILYLYGNTGMYLELPNGEPGINNVFQMAKEELKHEITVALHKASINQETVHVPAFDLKTNTHVATLSLSVRPVLSETILDSGTPLYLIILEQASLAIHSPTNKSNTLSADEITNERILELQKELELKDQYIKTTYVQQQISREELKSANEEMQSINEELQSTNEELETSKEEMQSLNEELSTVNAELQSKVHDLSRTNNDMNNLLSGTGIATLFVDFDLNILRFTPTAKSIINLIPSDIGRPIGHIVSNLVDYHSMQEDIHSVLETLIPKEIKVYTTMGKWYMMRIMPYRTTNNVIEGAVITFVDISDIVDAQELRHFAVVVHDAYDAITVQDLEGNITAWNPSATRMYGWSEAEAIAMNIQMRIPQSSKDEEISKLLKLSQQHILEPYLTQRLCKDGTSKEVWVTATILLNENKEPYAIATTERLNDSTLKEKL